MIFGKFSRIFAVLFLIAVDVRAQEDFIEGDVPVPPPPTGGLFDDELEPLNDKEIVRPSTPPAAPTAVDQHQQDHERNDDTRFPEPKRVTSSSPSRSIGKGLPNLPGDIPNRNEKVRMDFVQVEIEDIVKYFSERLKKKFIYDPTILSGKVTIISPTEVSMQEAYGAFLSAMEVRGYVIYPAGAFMKIEKAANARKVPVPVYEGSTPNDDSYVTRILTLKYLLVRDISQAVRNLLSRTGGDLIEHAPTNTLIISDYAYNIRRIVRILDVLDVESFQEQIEIIQLRNAAAPDIARKVQEFFPSTGAGAAPGGALPGSRLSRRSGGGAEGDSGVIQKVVADERTNCIIVLGSERGIEQVKKFIARIDIATEGGGGQIHVYPIQNVKADEIAATLSALAAGKSKSGGLPLFPTPPPLPGSPSSAPSAPDVATLGDVKITADKATNSLVIQSSPRDFEVLKTIIRKLDIRRRQVFIEGAILEANVLKGFNFNPQIAGPLARPDALGVRDANGNVTTPSGVIGAMNGLGFDQFLKGAIADPTTLTGVALGFRSGSTYTITTKDANGNDVRTPVPLLSAVLQLSATNNNVNIISTPHILATANEEAMLSIGSEIPQNAGSTQTATGFSQANITRLKVATELTITPQINQGDYLTLKIKEKITDTGTNDKVLGLTTINREASTTVIVKDQQTVVIGGLMRDKQTVSITKVPLLGDIPILGWLFKSTNKGTDKVNLLLFLTPYIIRDTGDMNDQFFRKLKEREGFLKEHDIDEKQGVPSSGLSEEQLQMLDKEYVKSLQKKFVYPKSAQSQPENLELKKEESKAAPAPMTGGPAHGASELAPIAPQDVGTPQTPTPNSPSDTKIEMHSGDAASPTHDQAKPVEIPLPNSAPQQEMPMPDIKVEPAPAPHTELPPILPPPSNIQTTPLEAPKTDLLPPPLPAAPLTPTAPETKSPVESSTKGSSQKETAPSKEWILEDSPPER
jgi:general secretion pathway protein D